MTTKDAKPDHTYSIPLVEESPQVDKHIIEGDTVTVSTRTIEDTEWVRETLSSETVDISRVPIGKDVSVIPSIREEGDVTIVPVVEERLVVTKQLHLVEEIHIGKKRTRTAVSEPVVVRRMQAVIDRAPSEQKTD